jgi:hypothetical protein
MWCHLEKEPRLAWCLRPKGFQFGGEKEAEWVIRPESNCHHPLLPSEDAGGELFPLLEYLFPLLDSKLQPGQILRRILA